MAVHIQLQTDTFFLQPLAAFFFTVFATVNFLFFIGKDKYMGQPLFDGSDAPGVFAFDDIAYFLGEGKLPLVYDFPVFNYIYRNVVVDKRKHI